MTTATVAMRTPRRWNASAIPFRISQPEGAPLL